LRITGHDWAAVHLACRFACCIVTAAVAGLAIGQMPVPLGDTSSDPLLPTSVVSDDVEISGALSSLWQGENGEQVVHMVGDFELSVGGRRLSAREGVVWIQTRRFQNRSFRSFDVFLSHNARIRESAGTVTEGPLLFASLSSSGEVFVSADRVARGDGSDTSVLRDAERLRAEIRSGTLGSGSPVATSAVTQGPVPAERAPVPSEIVYSADRTTLSTLEDGRQIVTAIGNVSVTRTDPGGPNAMELFAESAVIFLKTGQKVTDVESALSPQRDDQASDDTESPIEAVYLEGDIRMYVGDRTVRASRLYYDLLHDRALILDAVLFAMVPDRNLPIYVRAAEIRQLSLREYSADDAKLTTSEFHTPHYHVGADHIEIVDETPSGFSGARVGLARARYQMRGATFNLNNTPLMYWPWGRGSVGAGDTSLRGLSLGADGDFGVKVESEWDFFNLLNFEAPTGATATLHADYFSKRGPALGLDVDYEREHSFGLYRGYVIQDRGDDNLGRFRDNERDEDTRGRTTFRHRQYLPNDWELSFEVSFLSDPGFLEEFFENEFDLDKEQETLLYLKKQRDNWAFTSLLQFRLNDFLTQTERLPDFSFRLIGEPVGRIGTWFSENLAGVVRYRAAEKEFFLALRRGSDGPSSGSTSRIDTRQEIEFPVTLGPVKLVPFVTLRGTAWDDSPSEGGLTRGMATYGVRSSMYLSRVYPDFENELLDVHGVRHIIKPTVVGWLSDSNRDSDELFPFDSTVEADVDDFDGVQVGVRQRWQTKRMGVNGPRTVDWITFDVDLGVFNGPPGVNITNGFVSATRPENSVARNFVNTDFIWRFNDSTVLASEMNYDINDGEVDVFNLSVAVDRPPRFGYLVGYRFIEEANSNLLAFGMNYKVDQKHTLAIREEFDLARGETLDFSVGYIRKFPRWYVALTFELDEAIDDSVLSLSVWPEGLPRATLGSRRFSGLATSASVTRR